MNKKLKIVFAGGGTGGHLYPAVALCEEFINQLGKDNVEVLFIGSHYGIEKDIVPKLGYAYKALWIRGIQRQFNWSAIKVNVLAPFRIISSFIHAYFIIKKYNPDIAIGTGGYASGPAISMAGKLGIPVFLQEQNVYPGMTTRMLKKYAHKIYVSYRDSKQYLSNISTLGTPLRGSLSQKNKNESLQKFNLSKERATIFVFGGSQGSRAINRFLRRNIDTIIDQTKTQFIWQTGKYDYKSIAQQFSQHQHIHVTKFIYEMDYAYSAADVVVCRSGALTLAELSQFGKAAILIPLPTAAGNHQEKNARSLEKAGAAKVILQQNLTTEKLIDSIMDIINNDKEKIAMETKAANQAKPEAAKNIVKDILKELHAKE